jgi:hypothetical protein
VADLQEWRDLETQILGRLDIAAEYCAMGAVLVGSPSAKGWQECHAFGRKDDNASAAFNVGSGRIRGRWRDLGGEGLSLNFWEFAAKFGGYGDWRGARAFYANKVSVKLPGGGEPKRPGDMLVFTNENPADDSELILGMWCEAKGGFDVAAAKAQGVRLARYPAKSKPEFAQDVVAFPAYGGPAFLDRDPCAWVVANRTGELVKLYKGKGRPPSFEKTLSVGGSVGGLLGLAALKRLAEIEPGTDLTIWKVEGLSDLLTLTAAIASAGVSDSHFVLSNSQGTLETVKPEWVHLLKGQRVFVIHDCDRPGRIGAQRWCQGLAGVAGEVKDVVLPYEIREKHGEDVRDYLFRDKHTLAELFALAEAVAPFTPPDLPEATSDAGTPPRPALPVIQGNKRQLREITADAMSAIWSGNKPPTVFQRGGLARIRINPKDEAPFVDLMKESAIRHVLARKADWLEVDQKGNLDAAPPPIAVVRDIAAMPEWPRIPVIEGIIDCPVFARNGRLIDQTGYDADSGWWLHLGSDLKLPPVPSSPSAEDITRARDLILTELMGDFPFAGRDDGGQASKANAVAAMLTPYVRQLIDGPTPMHLISAPTEGTGKGLLISCICLPTTGREPAVAPEFRDESEAQKRLMAILLKAPTFVLLDNLSKILDSASLAAVLTARNWTDRILGGSTTATLPINNSWLASGNNPRMTPELVRRTVLSRLDSGQENPATRTGFKHPALLAWAKEHRGELVWACLTLCQAWLAAGRRKGKQVMGSYEAWAEVIGGILDVADIEGLLENRDELRSTAISRDSEWKAFVNSWNAEFGATPVGVKELYKMASENGLLDKVLGDEGERSQRTRLGLALGGMRDRVVEGYRIAEAPEDHSGRQRYVLQKPIAGTVGPKAERSKAASGHEMELSA